MSDALGMVETRGLIGAIAAADAGLKTAEVCLLGTERVDPAMVTVSFGGDVAAVRAAVDAGASAAAEVGELIAQHVIPRPQLDSVHQSPESPSGKSTSPCQPTAGDLEGMNVADLRRLARQTPEVSLHGREISKANRSVLVQELARVLQ